MNLILVLYSLLIIVGVTFFFLFIGIKLIYRLKARFGRPTPCPMSFVWTLEIAGRKHNIPKLLNWAGVRPGERVLDLGCGPGVFTVEIARRVERQGRVIAIDVQPGMIARAEQRVRQAELANVSFQLADAHRLSLKDGCVDRALLITVLAEIPDSRAALAQVHRVLAGDGVLSITEEFFDPDYVFSSETIRLVESCGFRLDQLNGNIWRYTANFCKDSRPALRGD